MDNQVTTVPAAAPGLTVTVAAVCVVLGWAALLWLSLNMQTPLGRLVMPGSGRWTAVEALAVLAMWSVMMAAMMLPSAAPMLKTFGKVSDELRLAAFLSAYVAVWMVFSAAATTAQWALQRAGLVDAMAASTSRGFSLALLVIAGIYQLSPVKRACLSGCREPVLFIMAHWRAGAAGAFEMGLRHGLVCLGCCWALMGLLFVGGAMNLACVAALAVAVAAEKLLPGGRRLSAALGFALIAAGALNVLAAP